MSAAIVSAFHHDYRDLYKGLQSHRATTDFRQQVSALERQLTGQLVNSYAASSLINIPVSSQGSPVSAISSLSSLSNVKTPTKQHAPLTSSNSVANCNVASHVKSVSSNREHRKLDRSVSEPADRSQANLRPAPPNSSRYKTELCRPFEENGTCKYGDKCQFAHGVGELRTLTRHPKYKTELCRTFHTTGFCPYGPRCHFIHNSEDAKKCLLNTLQNNSSPAGNVGLSSGNVNISSGNQGNVVSPGNVSVTQANISVSPPKLSNGHITKDLEICSFSLGSTGDLSPTSSSSSSGSPTSSLGGFFVDDSHMSYNLPQVPQTAPPTVNNSFFFGPDYTPALTISSLVSQQDYYSTQPGYETEDNMLSSINLLVSEMDNINCCEGDSIKTDLSGKTDPGTAVDANRNVLRLPIFSRLAHGSSP